MTPAPLRVLMAEDEWLALADGRAPPLVGDGPSTGEAPAPDTD